MASPSNEKKTSSKSVELAVSILTHLESAGALIKTKDGVRNVRNPETLESIIQLIENHRIKHETITNLSTELSKISVNASSTFSKESYVPVHKKHSTKLRDGIDKKRYRVEYKLKSKFGNNVELWGSKTYAAYTEYGAKQHCHTEFDGQFEVTIESATDVEEFLQKLEDPNTPKFPTDFKPVVTGESTQGTTIADLGITKVPRITPTAPAEPVSIPVRKKSDNLWGTFMTSLLETEISDDAPLDPKITTITRPKAVDDEGWVQRSNGNSGRGKVVELPPVAERPWEKYGYLKTWFGNVLSNLDVLHNIHPADDVENDLFGNLAYRCWQLNCSHEDAADMLAKEIRNHWNNGHFKRFANTVLSKLSAEHRIYALLSEIHEKWHLGHSILDTVDDLVTKRSEVLAPPSVMPLD